MNSPIRSRAGVLLLALLAAFAFTARSAETQELGPADGHDLAPTELERVMVGNEAPLFTLESYDRGPVALAGFRGDKNVVLVFYRGQW